MESTRHFHEVRKLGELRQLPGVDYPQQPADKNIQKVLVNFFFTFPHHDIAQAILAVLLRVVILNVLDLGKRSGEGHKVLWRIKEDREEKERGLLLRRLKALSP